MAVILHGIPQGLTGCLLLKKGGFKNKAVVAAAALQGALYPIGAALAAFIPTEMNPAVLAFVAGNFLYIGASDLLPDAHEEYNWKVIACVLLGAMFFLGIKTVFGAA
ncbi:Zinc transporter ZupT [uncultured archaeon]|nr:Zinc transporter ZupT [uncultured archaeon]